MEIMSFSLFVSIIDFIFYSNQYYLRANIYQKYTQRIRCLYDNKLPFLKMLKQHEILICQLVLKCYISCQISTFILIKHSFVKMSKTIRNFVPQSCRTLDRFYNNVRYKIIFKSKNIFNNDVYR